MNEDTPAWYHGKESKMSFLCILALISGQCSRFWGNEVVLLYYLKKLSTSHSNFPSAQLLSAYIRRALDVIYAIFDQARYVRRTVPILWFEGRLKYFQSVNGLTCSTFKWNIEGSLQFHGCVLKFQESNYRLSWIICCGRWRPFPFWQLNSQLYQCNISVKFYGRA